MSCETCRSFRSKDNDISKKTFSTLEIYGARLNFDGICLRFPRTEFVYKDHYCDEYKQLEYKLKVKDEESDPCPDCGAPIRAKELWEGGGVECSKKCGYWFCY
jgi:hypothetical protein